MWPCATARSVARLCCRLCHLSGPAARSCLPLHGRTSFLLLLFALPGLRLTSILPSTPCKVYLCSQNPKVFPKNTDKPQYQHIWIKGSKSIPFSCGFSMKTERNMDQERAKIGQNGGLSMVDIRKALKRVLLLARASDAQNHWFPLAYGIVESKNNDSWTKLFTAPLHVVGIEDHHKLTVISDICKVKATVFYSNIT